MQNSFLFLLTCKTANLNIWISSISLQKDRTLMFLKRKDYLLLPQARNYTFFTDSAKWLYHAFFIFIKTSHFKLRLSHNYTVINILRVRSTWWTSVWLLCPKDSSKSKWTTGEGSFIPFAHAWQLLGRTQAEVLFYFVHISRTDNSVVPMWFLN